MPAVGNIIEETSVSTSTGDFTIASKFGRRTFNTEFGTGGTDVFDYFILHRDANEWEIGTGHLSSSTTLVRDTVVASSNADALVNFSAGTKDVTNDIPAANTVQTTDVQGQQTIYVPASAMVANLTNGATPSVVELGTGDSLMKSRLLFDQSTDEKAEFSVQMPKSWDAGTVVAQFLWETGATTGDVIWTIAGVSIGDDDPIGTTLGTAQSVTDTAGSAAGDLMISAESSAVTLGGTPAAEEWAIFRVTRDADNVSDTVATDARLLGVKIHYTTSAATDD